MQVGPPDPPSIKRGVFSQQASHSACHLEKLFKVFSLASGQTRKELVTCVPPDAEILESIRLVRARDGFVRCSEVAKLLNMRTRSSARVFAMCRSVSSSRLSSDF